MDIAGVTRKKYSPEQIYSGVKMAYAGFTLITPKRVKYSNTIFTPREMCRLILAWLGTKHVEVRLLHATVSELWHEKDVLTSPEERDKEAVGSR